MFSSQLACSSLSKLLIDVCCLPDTFSVLYFICKQEVLFVGVKDTLYQFLKTNDKLSFWIYLFKFIGKYLV